MSLYTEQMIKQNVSNGKPTIFESFKYVNGIRTNLKNTFNLNPDGTITSTTPTGKSGHYWNKDRNPLPKWEIVDTKLEIYSNVLDLRTSENAFQLPLSKDQYYCLKKNKKNRNPIIEIKLQENSIYAWFTENNIPQNVQKILEDLGYKTIEDLQSLYSDASTKKKLRKLLMDRGLNDPESIKLAQSMEKCSLLC